MTDPQEPGATPPSYSPPPSTPAQSYPGQAPDQAGYAQAPAYDPAYGGVAPTVPGKTLGLVAFIGSLVIAPLSVLWLILGIVARVQSNKVGYKNGFALAAIIISIVALIVSIIVTIFIVMGVVAGVGFIAERCNELGPGTHTIEGVTITCS